MATIGEKEADLCNDSTLKYDCGLKLQANRVTTDHDMTNTYFGQVKSSPHVATVELGGTLTRGMMVVDQRVGTILVSFDFDVLKGWHIFGVFWY